MKRKRIKKALAGTMVMAMVVSGPVTGSGAALAAETSPVFPQVYTSNYIDAGLQETEASIQAKVEALIKTMTQEEKFSFLGGNGTGTEGNAGYLKGVPRLGVPESKMYDGPAGVLYTQDTTNPPIEQMVAATWDKESAYDYGKIHGSENRALGGNIQLGSQFDITRAPQFGRAKDQFGEDPYLLSDMAAEDTKGIQDQGVIAVGKHFAAFSQAATPATSTNIEVSEQALHEIHLPGFEAAVTKGGLLGMMSSYNLVNGTFASSNTYLQLDVLRDMWQYKGFTVTDWGGNDGFTLNKGTDIEMPSLSANKQSKAEALIADGTLTQNDIDDAVRHVLTALGQAGYLNLVKIDGQGYAKEQTGRTEAIDLAADLNKLATARQTNSEISQQIAEKGAVLLKNEDGALPLKKENTTAVIGLNGMHLISGVDGERSYGTISEMVSPYEALTEILGEEQVEGQVALDLVGEAIPAENLYTNPHEGSNGVTRSYGTGASEGTSEDQQGQIKTAGSIAEKKMGDHPIGTFATVDNDINFTTGTINGKPNKTYKNSADGTAFTKESGAAYTWTTYIKAPETGQYSIKLEGIGGQIAATVQTSTYDPNASDADVKSVSLGIASINQGTQWPSDSIIPTETGKSISSASVTFEAGKYYKVIVAGIASLAEKDLQVRLAWITPSQAQANYDNAIEAARNNDTSVVFAYRKTTDTASTLAATTNRLPDEQEKLILDVAEAAHEAGHKVVVVLNNSTAVTMEKWIDKVDGLLEMYFPGQRGGVATARLLTGEVNPSGKLAFTIPKKDTDTLITYSQEYFDMQKIEEESGKEIDYTQWIPMLGNTVEEVKARQQAMGMKPGIINTSIYYEGIMTGYRWYDAYDVEPQYDFGYGLSYTSFEYSDLSVTPSTTNGEKAGYNVTFTVTNTGDVAGTEIAQLYLGAADQAALGEGIQTPEYQLAGYERVENLGVNQSKRVTLHVNERSLSYWNSNQEEVTDNADGTKGKWTVANGPRTIYVGPASDELLLSKQITVSAGESSDVVAELNGTSNVSPGSSFSLNVTLSKLSKGIYAEDLVVSYDPQLVEFIEAQSLLSGVKVVDYDSDEPGRLRILMASEGENKAINADGDILKLNWKAKSVTAASTAVFKIVSAVLSDGETEFTADSTSSHSIQITARLEGDVNGDGKISVLDLAKVAKNYGKTSASTDWETVKAMDMNNDNVIDVEDLVQIAKKILE